MKRWPAGDLWLLKCRCVAWLDEVCFDRRLRHRGAGRRSRRFKDVTEPYRMMMARADYRPFTEGRQCGDPRWRAAPDQGALGASIIIESRTSGSAPKAQWHFRTEEGQADLLYRPDIERQGRDGKIFSETRRGIPSGFDYSAVAGLSNEMVERLDRRDQKLSTRRPELVGSHRLPFRHFISRFAGAQPRDRPARRGFGEMFHVKHSRSSSSMSRASARS